MSEYRLLQHKDFERSLQDLSPTTQRKTVWAQVLLGTRGRTPNVKGTMGRNARWRRTPVQGNHYYMWWIPQSESLLSRRGNDVDDANVSADSTGTTAQRDTADSVNTILVKGKTKRFRGRLGQRSDYKKAMVRLAEGHSIDVTTGL